MSRAKKKLPDFDNPPVVEVVAGVQFEPLDLPIAVFGKWWDDIRVSYPHTEDKPPLDHRIEQFGATSPPRVRFEMKSIPPKPRIWFMDKPDGEELLQLQDDRLLFNWRGHDGNSKYPRFGFVKKKFLERLKSFRSFLNSNCGVDISIDQCELTYINHIYKGLGWNEFRDINNVFAFLKDISPTRSDQELEYLNFRIARLVNDKNGNHIARLHISSDKRISNKSGGEILYLDLSVRGAPKDNKEKSISEFLDTSHEHIVESFADITTTDMHKLWGRKDV